MEYEKWEINYTHEAENDLRRIYEYIAYELLEVESAASQTNRIMNKINSLDVFQYRYKLYEVEPLKSRGLRVLPADNYLIFYLPIEKEKKVSIIRIMYGARNIEEYLK